MLIDLIGTFFICLARENKMKLYTRCLPLGALPYETVEAATKIEAKLFEKMPTYDGETLTLESPVMLPDGTHDLEKLNRSLSFLKEKMGKY